MHFSSFLLYKISSNSGVPRDRITPIYGGLTFVRNFLIARETLVPMKVCCPDLLWLFFFGLKIVDFYQGPLPSVSQTNVFSGNKYTCLCAQTFYLGNTTGSYPGSIHLKFVRSNFLSDVLIVTISS